MMTFPRLAMIPFLLAVPILAGCHDPLYRTDLADYKTYEGPPMVWPEWDEPGRVATYYVPSRIVDLFDIVHVPLGIGLPLGLDLRVTKWFQLALQAGAGVGVNWNGRKHQPLSYGAHATAAFGPWRATAGRGETMSVNDWEVGLGFGGAGKLAIDFGELADFVTSFFLYDLSRDDWGHRPPEEPAVGEGK
ncbi:MAG: hypothetical protein HY720_23505 [Planctomycetes bacterium]|nr:hypothetical protein [Planctomycetota bacterium]